MTRKRTPTEARLPENRTHGLRLEREPGIVRFMRSEAGSVAVDSRPEGTQRPWGERWVRWCGRRSVPAAAALNLMVAAFLYVRESDGPLVFKNLFIVSFMLALLVFERWQFYRIVDRQDRELAELRATLAEPKKRD
jgi:hypothetical protein